LWTQHRAANPERLHQPDGRNAVAFRRETLDRPAAQARPPQGGGRDKPRSTVAALRPSASTMATG